MDTKDKENVIDNGKSSSKKKAEESIHSGHRARMREKFKTSRASMPDHEILEMLLYAVTPRINTNIMAHELIKKGGGTLNGVLELDEETIMRISGTNKNTVPFIHLLSELNVRLKRERISFPSGRRLTRVNVVPKLRKYFLASKEEKFVMVTADEDVNHINTHILSNGTDSAAIVPMRNIIRLALDDKASYVFLAHNHPNGILAPTQSDLNATKAICEALQLINVVVLEHFIITDRAYIGIFKTDNE